MAKTIFFLFLVGVGFVFYVIKADLIDLDELTSKLLGTKKAIPSATENPSKVQELSSPPRGNSRTTFPVDRTVIDTQGRPLEATILGKSDGSIAVRRSSDGKEFVIALSKLSDADRQFFSTMADHKAVIARPNQMSGRVARWNSDLTSAKREAAKFGIPIYLIFTGTSWCPPCQQMEREVLNTSSFREFANHNVVLMKIVVPGSRKLRGLDAQLSDRFGINSYPTVLLLTVDGEEIYKKSGASTDPQGHISKMKRLIAEAK